MPAGTWLPARSVCLRSAQSTHCTLNFDAACPQEESNRTLDTWGPRVTSQSIGHRLVAAQWSSVAGSSSKDCPLPRHPCYSWWFVDVFQRAISAFRPWQQAHIVSHWSNLSGCSWRGACLGACPERCLSGYGHGGAGRPVS